MTEDPSWALTAATNSALCALLGKWQIEVASNCSSYHSPDSKPFSWHEDGAFLKIMRRSTYMGSRDETSETSCLPSSDWQGILRISRVSLSNGQCQQWRHAPGFSQRFTGAVSPDGKTIPARWEISSDSEQWKLDVDLTYPRISEVETSLKKG